MKKNDMKEFKFALDWLFDFFDDCVYEYEFDFGLDRNSFYNFDEFLKHQPKLQNYIFQSKDFIRNTTPEMQAHAFGLFDLADQIARKWQNKNANDLDIAV